jgi:signal transduction histidine kinase
MNPDQLEPVVLEAPLRKERTWVYPWIGILFGLALGIFIGHPLSMLVNEFYDFIYAGTPMDVNGAFAQTFHWQMWPMMLIYAVFGGIVWGFIGFILKHLRDSRFRLDTLHEEFELQVATLRHHYKNLAIGIHGFAGRIKRKLTNLDEQFRDCAKDTPALYNPFRQEFESLGHNVTILEEAAQRLTHTLGQELLFLKALTSSTLPTVPRDFYPFLAHCVDDLVGLRFHDKDVRVEINGQPVEACRDSLVFAFEPHSVEVVLQNVLSNAMKYGDHIQIGVTDVGDRLRVEVRDNGPGMDVQELKHQLVIPGGRREAESTHLGLQVSIHLLGKIGGHLSAWSRPGEGAIFIMEFPKHLVRIP